MADSYANACAMLRFNPAHTFDAGTSPFVWLVWKGRITESFLASPKGDLVQINSGIKVLVVGLIPRLGGPVELWLVDETSPHTTVPMAITTDRVFAGLPAEHQQKARELGYKTLEERCTPEIRAPVNPKTYPRQAREIG